MKYRIEKLKFDKILEIRLNIKYVLNDILVKKKRYPRFSFFLPDIREECWREEI